MANSAFSLLKELKLVKTASAMSGSFLPPEPLPNSVKANQVEQQELAQQQAEDGAGAGNEQMQQMQKAQEDAVKQLQQTQQQLAQTQSEMQTLQQQTQQQVQQAQADAQQQISKAQMDAQYELQSEKIKGQQKMLQMQEKYTRSLNKETPHQSHILGTQLKRIVKKVNSLNKAAAAQAGAVDQDIITPQANNRLAENEQKQYGASMPHINVTPSKRTQQQWDEISNWKRQKQVNDPRNAKLEQDVMSKPSDISQGGGYWKQFGNYWSDPHKYMKENKPFGDGWGKTIYDSTLGFTDDFNSGLSNLGRGNFVNGARDLAAGIAGGAASIGMVGGLGGGLLKGVAGRIGSKALGRLGSAAQNMMPSALNGLVPSMGLGLGAHMLSTRPGEETSAPEADVNPGGGNTPTPGVNPLASLGGGGFYNAPQGAQQQRWDTGMTPAERFSAMNTAQDMQKYSAVQPAKTKEPVKNNTDMYSPIPILQSTGYMRPHLFKDDPFNPSKQHGYGPMGDFIKNILFNYAIPMFTGIRPGQPDVASMHQHLANPQPYLQNVSNAYSHTTF